jgi:hypothetical protein
MLVVVKCFPPKGMTINANEHPDSYSVTTIKSTPTHPEVTAPSGRWMEMSNDILIYAARCIFSFIAATSTNHVRHFVGPRRAMDKIDKKHMTRKLNRMPQ